MTRTLVATPDPDPLQRPTVVVPVRSGQSAWITIRPTLTIGQLLVNGSTTWWRLQ